MTFSGATGSASPLTHRYLYGPQTDQVPATADLRLADEVFAEGGTGLRPVSDEVLWLLADHQGTIREVMDSAGTLRKHVEYDSFGSVTDEESCDRQGATIADPATHAEAVDQLFYYTGREWDGESHLYNHRARWYDPAMGRFLSEDPSGLGAGNDANLYRYVGNSPVNFTDPTGLRQAGNPAESLARDLMADYYRTPTLAETPLPSYDYYSTLVRPSYRDITPVATTPPADEGGLLSNAWTYTKAVGAGLAQGTANLANVVTDTAIAIPNTVPLAWNYTAGWVAPNCPYIPSPDWSRGLVSGAYETDASHAWSKGAGNIALIAGTSAVSLQAQAARAAEAAAAQRAAAAAAEQAAARVAAEQAAAKAATVGRGIWDLTPEARWTAVEQQLGKNLPSNYPVIDKFQKGIATSIKSMDLAAPTYSNPAAVTRVGQGYVDKAAAFQGRSWARVDIRASQITGRGVDLAIPPGATAAQRQAIQRLVGYGRQQGVTVNIVEMR